MVEVGRVPSMDRGCRRHVSDCCRHLGTRRVKDSRRRGQEKALCQDAIGDFRPGFRSLLPRKYLAEGGPNSRRGRSEASGRILCLAHIHPIGSVPQIVTQQLHGEINHLLAPRSLESRQGRDICNAGIRADSFRRQRLRQALDLLPNVHENPEWLREGGRVLELLRCQHIGRLDT